jgi:hypothetical protein
VGENMNNKEIIVDDFLEKLREIDEQEDEKAENEGTQG